MQFPRMKEIREDASLKQKDVAEFLKMSRTTYNHYELGHSTFTADMIVSLAKLFHTTPNVLLNFDSSLEVTDPDLLKLCKFVREENINIDKLIYIISLSKDLFS